MSSLRAGLAVLATSLIVAGCSESSTGPSTNTLDVTSLLAEMSPSTLGAATSIALPELGVLFRAVPVTDPGGCVFTESSGFFVCPTVTANGFTFTRMFKLLDAGGNALSKPSALVIAIESKSTMTGTLTVNATGSPLNRSLGTGPISIDRSDDMTLSGIQTAKHTLDGSATSTVTTTLTTAEGSIQTKVDQSEQTTGLVLPNVKAGQQWPQSGSIAIQQTTTFGQTLPFVTIEKLTFTGTSKVLVTFTSPLGTQSCTFDLAARTSEGMTCSTP